MVSLNAAEEFYITWILDDIKLYLDKFSNILNNIAILDRSFLDMKFLKPIFCATALIGLHVTGPYFALLLSKQNKKQTMMCFSEPKGAIFGFGPKRMRTWVHF